MQSEKQSQIRTYFQIEARELINTLTEGAAQLDGSPIAPDLLQRLQRAAHTLKGAAHVVGESTVARIAHDFEDVLAVYLETPSAPAAAQMLALADGLADELSGPKPPALQPSTSTPASLEPDPPEPQQRTLRVELGETERLLNHVAETARLVTGLQTMLGQARSPQAAEPLSGPTAALLDAVQDQVDRLARQTADLYRTSSQLRLISSGTLLLDAGRMVRATAESLDKQVLCVTRGGRERIDVRVLEPLEAALLHLVRNAVAHGVESQAERRQLGKPPVASITVELQRTGSVVRLLCADDGRGIDVERIRAAALAQGLLAPDDARRATRHDLFELLFRGGFSTSPAVDEVSGRGIGLDAVRSNISRLGGTVTVDSTLGAGTRFTLTVPQTLVAFRALEITAGGVSFAVPFNAVEQTFLRGEHHTIVADGERGETLFDGSNAMPFLRLSEAIPNSGVAQRGQGLPAAEAQPSRPPCLVLASEQTRLVLEVDRLVDVADLLVRPLPAFIGASPMIAGASISASGEPMLILDPAGLATLAATPGLRTASPRTAGPRPTAPKPILVIDDSLTTRTLEQSILEAEGYTVNVANSAEQGLQLARQKQYALFLVDVEMPGMNGFDFVRAVQADPDLRVTPSIMVTSLDSAESRALGRAAGAESYIVKGEFNQKVYLDRIRALIGFAPGHASRVAS